MLPECFPAVNIRQMHFDEGHGNGRQRITQGDTGMREGGRIEDDECYLTSRCLLYAVDQCSFVVRLEAFETMAVRRAQSFQFRIDGIQPGRAVDLRFTRAEQVQIRSVQGPEQFR